MSGRVWMAMAAGVLMMAGVARAEHYDVFVLAGQSNMDGRAKVADLKGDLEKYAGPQADVKIAYSDSTARGAPLSSKGWEELKPGFSVTTGKEKPRALPGPTFGPELSFGRAMADALGKQHHVAIIKFAEGGTSLAKDWKVGTDGKLYAQMLAFVSKSLDDMKAHGDTFELRGFVWHQGESDATLTAEQYEKLLTNLIEHVRTDLKPYRGNAAGELPVVVGEVYDNHQRDSILAAQRSVCEKVKDCALAGSNGLNTFDKGTHFDAESQIEMGKRMAAAMLTMLKGGPE
ncbi:MAG TPA: sialate O-acetylesterase [Phycisphaerae bacterium]|nr:sialate O-acetylesterase [Phycisphaerae bacterium]